MNEFIPNRYKILQKIGEGVHGVVLKAIDTTEGNKTVAIKKVPLRTKFGGNWELFLKKKTLKLFSRNFTKHLAWNQNSAALRLWICKKNNFSNFHFIFLFCFQIISLLDIYPDLCGIALVFDFMPHTLYSKLKDEENPLSRQQIHSYTKMLLRGLSYLHDDLKIMHRVKSKTRPRYMKISSALVF